jgi:DNA-binding IclR family transcriptional regulator
VRQQYHYVDKSSGVGVVDKTVALLDAVGDRPRSLAELVEATGLPRPTAHRLALALERHHVLDRDEDGRFVIGARTARWGAGVDVLRNRAEDVVLALRDATGVSAQVYRRAGDQRLCIASAEPAVGLRDTVPVGSLLTLKAGSAAQVLVAWLPPDERADRLQDAAFDEADLAKVRRRGWAHSLAQREPGVASLSVPVHGPADDVIAAVSLSGPVDRLARASRSQVAALTNAASALAPGG